MDINLTEANLDYAVQKRKMNELNNGVRKNIAAMGVDKLNFNRIVCQNEGYDYALDQIEDEMVKRGLITFASTRKGKKAAAFNQPKPQPQPAPAPAPAPQPQPASAAQQATAASNILASVQDQYIPTEKDFQIVSEALEDYLTNGYEEMDYFHTPNGISDDYALDANAGHFESFRAIRILIAAALLGYKDLVTHLTTNLKAAGIDSETIKKIFNYVLSKQSVFMPLLTKYKVKKESLEEAINNLIESFNINEVTDYDTFIPTEEDFRKTYQAMEDCLLRAKENEDHSYDGASLIHLPTRIPGLLISKYKDTGTILVIRRLIAASLFKWKEFVDAAKNALKREGLSGDDIKNIFNYIMQHQSAFANYYMNYAPKVATLIANTKVESLQEDFEEPDIETLLNAEIEKWDTNSLLTEEEDLSAWVNWTTPDFDMTEILFINNNLDNPKAIIGNALTVNGTIKTLFISLVIATLLHAPESTVKAIREFLNVNCGINKAEAAGVLRKLSENKDVTRHLINNIKEVEQMAAAQAAAQQMAHASGQSTGGQQIDLKISGYSNNFYRLIVYDMRYNPHVRRHIYLSTKVGDKYTVTIGNADMTGHSWVDEPLFDTVPQAEEFIHNLNNNNVKTRIDLNNFRYVITDKPIDLGTDYQGKKYLIKDLKDSVIVDTVCGWAFIQRKNNKCVESLEEDTVKQGNKWVNKGKEGTHGEFKTKKAADAQRKAMFANGYHEDLNENIKSIDDPTLVAGDAFKGYIKGRPQVCLVDLVNDDKVECHDEYARKWTFWKIPEAPKANGRPLFRPAVESLDINEDVEKHETLNPVLFDNNHLKPEVREKALELVAEVGNSLERDGVKFNVKDIILTGSNASYNYTKDSDIDIHIIADTSEFDDPDKLYPIIYNAYKSMFNNKFEVTFYGIPVEIYIETEDTGRISNGVYSILNDVWVKEPTETIIPEIDQEAFQKAFKPWEDEYKELIANIDKESSTDEKPIDDFIDKLYVLRQDGLHNGGEYSFENLIFKEMRNREYLHNLKELKTQVITNRLTLESLAENCTIGEDLDEQTRRQLVIKLSQIAHNQAILQVNGLFHIYNVSADDVDNIVRNIQRLDFVDYVNSSASKFDFSKINFNGMPSRYYTITGKVKN